MNEAALYEQLAEEAAELAHAALKVARILRGENPTPVTIETASAGLVEEFTDVTLCSSVLGLAPDQEMVGMKYRRWRKRLEESGMKIGDTIKCHDAEGAGELLSALYKEGYVVDWTFPDDCRVMLVITGKDAEETT